MNVREDRQRPRWDDASIVHSAKGVSSVVTRLGTLMMAVLGPITVLLYETDSWPFSAPANLLLLAGVVLASTAGLLFGILAASRGLAVLGFLSILTNGLVLALYGFLLVFFALGGSR